MTLTLDLPNEIAEAITAAAHRQGRFQKDIAALLADDAVEEAALSEQGFLLAAEGTWHIWDTPEEDKAWAHL